MSEEQVVSEELREAYATCALNAMELALGLSLSEDQRRAAIDAMKPEIAVVFVRHENRAEDERTVFASAFTAYLNDGLISGEPGREPEHELVAQDAVQVGRAAVLWYRLGTRAAAVEHVLRPADE